MTSGVRSKLHIVLLIEESATVRALYGKALRDSGLLVDEVVSIREAVMIGARLCPDIVVVARSLPDGDGWDVARALKAKPSTRHIPIVGLACHRERADVEGALVAGCDAFLDKGASPDALTRHVRGMLGLPLDGKDARALMVTARSRKLAVS